VQQHCNDERNEGQDVNDHGKAGDELTHPNSLLAIDHVETKRLCQGW